MKDLVDRIKNHLNPDKSRAGYVASKREMSNHITQVALEQSDMTLTMSKELKRKVDMNQDTPADWHRVEQQTQLRNFYLSQLSVS